MESKTSIKSLKHPPLGPARVLPCYLQELAGLSLVTGTCIDIITPSSSSEFHVAMCACGSAVSVFLELAPPLMRNVLYELAHRWRALVGNEDFSGEQVVYLNNYQRKHGCTS